MKLPRNKERKRNRRKIGRSLSNIQSLLKLRNIHRGEQCILLATGPSITLADLTLIAKHPNVVGVNGIYKTHQSLRYYFVSCPSFYLSNEDDIHRVDSEKTFLSSHIPFNPAYPRVYLKVFEKKYIYQQKVFHANLLRSLYGGPTVILDIVLPSLIWMGYSEIILVGADYSLTNYKHFYPEDEHKVIKPVDCEDEMILAHRSFDIVTKCLSRHGNAPKIINASPMSDLNCFPKMSLEEAMRS